MVALACLNESAICCMYGDALIVMILESQSKDWLCNHMGTVMSWSEREETDCAVNRVRIYVS